MTEAMRKKSTSSDSELSDGWSLVDHSETAPLTPRSGDAPQVHRSADPPELSKSDDSSSEQQSTNPASDDAPADESPSSGDAPLIALSDDPPVQTTDELSSDAESVDILQEEPRHLESTFPYSSRITTLRKGDVAKEGDEVKLKADEPLDVKEVLVNSDSGSDYLFNSSSIYSNEWTRLLIFISSLVALLLLLVSYTSLFFKEQPYSKSDGMIVLPDEDLSSLIAEMTLFKEENNRLKEELNMIKYEYGSNKKLSGKSEVPVSITSSDDIIGLEVISDDSPLNVEPISSKPSANSEEEDGTNASNTTGSKTEPERLPDSTTAKTDINRKRVENLAHLESNLKSFAENLGLKNLILSPYNIANNIESIHTIVKNIKSIIDKDTSPKRENRRYQIEQKLLKLHNKIEQDFKKIVEKVSKRVNKFHDEFLSAYCRIKGDTRGSDNLDCSKFERSQKEGYRSREYDHDNFKKQGKDFDSLDDLNNNDSSEEDLSILTGDNGLKLENRDSDMRYKRSSDDRHHDKPESKHYRNDNDDSAENDKHYDKHYHKKNYDSNRGGKRDFDGHHKYYKEYPKRDQDDRRRRDDKENFRSKEFREEWRGEKQER